MSCSERLRIQARWIFPVDGPPIEQGIIEVQDHTITAVHGRAEPDAVHLGNVAVLPGLVNAHTHLEFSDLPQPLVPDVPFFDWIPAVVACRRNRQSDIVSSVMSGIAESHRSGTTTVAEIAAADWTGASLPQPSPNLVIFRELYTLAKDEIDHQVALGRAHLEKCEISGHKSGPSVLCGLSPHAPYTVHPSLFHRLVQLACEFRAPLAMHLAESEAELQFLDRQAGECVEMLRRAGFWRDGIFPRGVRPLDYLQTLAQSDRALVIHGNYLSETEVMFLSQHPHLTVVYCPRTHAYFGHPEHPWQRMLERGASVALGTDSRASNPDLSLWNELLFLHQRYPTFDPGTLLELSTMRGAQALGLADRIGTLTVGKRADVTIVAFNGSTAGDPYSLLFDARNQPVGTMQAGQWVVRPTEASVD